MQILEPSNLEKTDNVVDTLNWKLQTIEEKNLPIAESLADYIAYGLRNLEAKIDHISEMEKILKAEKKSIKEQIERVKIDGARFLLDNGIDRLDGVMCSSITVSKPRCEKTEEVEKKEFKLLVSEAEAEELLVELGKAEIVTTTEVRTIKALPPKLRVNHKKVA